MFTLHVYTLDVSACGGIVGHFDDIRLGAECSLFKPYSLAPLNPYSYAHTCLAMKSWSHADYVLSHAFQLKHFFMNKSVKTLVCV